MGSFTPTDEQADAVALAVSGESMALEARAGTGKTATLELIGRATPNRRGLYVAFNKAIVEEAKSRMPSNVTPTTIHSLAYNAVGVNYRARMNSARQKPADVARFLGIDAFVATTRAGKKRLAPGFLATTYVGAALRNFCQSADPEPLLKHFPYLDGIDLPDADGNRTYDNNNALRDELASTLHIAWADLQKLPGDGGLLRFTHDHYLKMWQLTDPKLDVDFVLFDEAQDANPVMAAVVAEQECQRIYVGDSEQAIYEFTGAVNALGEIETDHRRYLTQSFRFGKAVADVANLVLDKLHASPGVVGSPELHSSVGTLDAPAALLCRTNARAMRAVFTAIADGRSVHLVGGGKEILDFAVGAASLMSSGWTRHAELACFSSWEEVQQYVEAHEDGGDLAMLVKLVDDHGTDAIEGALRKMPKEGHAQALISTAHKAKGREWGTVKIADDFVRLDKEGKPKPLSPPELRLMYVSVTRAMDVLDDGDVRVLYDPVEAVA
jgi:hypothetical protein